MTTKIGMRNRQVLKCMHKNLGEVLITHECVALQLCNPDPTSMFVEHDGEIKEVSRLMMKPLFGKRK